MRKRFTLLFTARDACLEVYTRTAIEPKSMVAAFRFEMPTPQQGNTLAMRWSETLNAHFQYVSPSEQPGKIVLRNFQIPPDCREIVIELHPWGPEGKHLDLRATVKDFRLLARSVWTAHNYITMKGTADEA
ncbi:MAG: hypothetical protein Q4B08_05535 [Propionibacteriaceae bacterium]|nr:hypothetical protein [Propionibacteriaceae bacterium]